VNHQRLDREKIDTVTDARWRLVMGTNDDFLLNLKPGDRVIVSGRFASDDMLKIVDRITKTQIIIGGVKFRRDNGYRIGTYQWNMVHLSPVTDEKLYRIRVVQARRFIADNFHKAWDDTAIEFAERIALDMEKT
jgi:hypothetical protein